PDAAAGAGQKQRAPWRVGGARHVVLMPSSRVQPRLGPRRLRRVTRKFDAVVQAEGTVVPELEVTGGNAPAAPARRARHLADHVLRRDFRNGLLEGEAAFQR